MRGLITALIGAAATSGTTRRQRKLGEMRVGLRYKDDGTPYIDIETEYFNIDVKQAGNQTLVLTLFQ